MKNNERENLRREWVNLESDMDDAITHLEIAAQVMPLIVLLYAPVYLLALLIRSICRAAVRAHDG